MRLQRRRPTGMASVDVGQHFGLPLLRYSFPMGEGVLRLALHSLDIREENWKWAVLCPTCWESPAPHRARCRSELHSCYDLEEEKALNSYLSERLSDLLDPLTAVLALEEWESWLKAEARRVSRSRAAGRLVEEWRLGAPERLAAMISENMEKLEEQQVLLAAAQKEVARLEAEWAELDAQEH